MSDTMATMASGISVAQAIAGQRPRISADAFKNLTARLKKADVVVPTVTIQVAPAAAPVVIAQPELPAAAVEPTIEIAPVIAVAAEALPAPVEDQFIWDVPAQEVQETVSPEIVAVPEVVEPSTLAPLVDDVVPQVEAAAEVIEADTQTQPLAVQPAAEPQLEGSFADNFTFVPENGKAAGEAPPAEVQAAPIDKEDISAAVREDVAQRQHELELENIWRMLLAKPTAEDRAIYLREAAEIIAVEGDMNAPAPEHDLSTIEPLAGVSEAEEPAADTAATERAVKPAATVLPEGQDVAELSRSLLDMMASGAASGQPQERALAADTLLRLVPRMELKPLIILAQRLSRMDNPPHLLVTRLIRDPRGEVSGPLLEDCAHIADKDLEAVIEENNPAKLRMVARRRKLSRAISDALIKSGDPSVVLTLVRNMEAEISHYGFESLLVLCEQNEELLAPLATRQDLSTPLAFELFWQAPSQLRRFILSRYLTDSETLTKILKITLATQTDEDGKDIEAASQHALLEGLERAARGHTEVASEELAATLQVSPATISRILSDVQGEALVILLKAAAYPRSAVSGLLKKMQNADMPVVSRDRDVAELQSMFETLSFNKARILLTYWDWAQSKTGPYAPVH